MNAIHLSSYLCFSLNPLLFTQKILYSRFGGILNIWQHAQLSQSLDYGLHVPINNFVLMMHAKPFESWWSPCTIPTIFSFPFPKEGQSRSWLGKKYPEHFSTKKYPRVGCPQTPNRSECINSRDTACWQKFAIRVLHIRCSLCQVFGLGCQSLGLAEQWKHTLCMRMSLLQFLKELMLPCNYRPTFT